MAEFTVREVIDGDTFKVQNGWKWNNKTGDTVRPTGYDTSDEIGRVLRCGIFGLLLRKQERGRASRKGYDCSCFIRAKTDCASTNSKVKVWRRHRKNFP